MGLYPFLPAMSIHTIRTNNPGLRFLISYWSKYCTLEPWHTDWARRHIRIPDSLRKGDVLYLDGDRQKNVYLVARGLLARVQYHDGKRQILSIALPGMALMTTDHLYSRTPSKGDIVVLRPHTIVIEIPYRAIRDFKDREPAIDTLIDVLGNKKRKQMATLRSATLGIKPFESYLRFVNELPELHHALTQTEAAQLLGISKTTLQSAHYFLVTGKHRKKAQISEPKSAV